MSETKFNADFRAVLRAQGLGNLHIREADQPGTADLAVWQGWRFLAWVELKVGDHKVEPHQWQFLEERVREGFRCFVITLSDSKDDPNAVHIGRVIGRGHKCYYEGYKPDFHVVWWPDVFKIAENL